MKPPTLQEQVAAKRSDKVFMGRLRASLNRNRKILDKLARQSHG